ncbi:MAG: TldD/PmbA family protein [Bacteroidales bacterium]|nr:TldD/PmbA family protein [Bacteroidales bacterium]
MIKPESYYLDLFQVTPRGLEELAASGIREGGSYCDLFFENTTYHELLLRDGIVSSGGFHIDYGVGIRVLKGDRTGYAYSESTDARSMRDAVKAASLIALRAITAQPVYPPAPPRGTEGRSPQTPCVATLRTQAGAVLPQAEPLATGRTQPQRSENGCGRGQRSVRQLKDYYPFERDWRKAETSGFEPYMERLQQKISASDQRVLKVIVSLSDQVSDIMMYNSLGELTFDTRPMGTIAVSVVFSSDGRIENKTVSRSFRTGAEMLTDALLDEIASEVVKGIDERFAARRPKGGKMPVVMGAGASGILLHEAMGHAFEADFNRKGQSIFSGRIGEKVCRHEISIVDDGTIPGNRGAVNYDDEGVPGQNTFMVRNGVLESYLHDRISANHFGVSPTGNGRRESFRYAPIPRMRATYMLGGKSTKDDIIASVKKGIYVDQFSNGQVQIGEGDFTFFVKSGFLIEDGRLTMPVKDINIIGNGPQALADIVAVGNDPKVDDGAWTCGKGQSCPVSCGIPTVLVNNLTVGGE